jgi:cold shock CspA family protein
MRTHGTLTKWNDQKGFGFVALSQSHEEVFVHISAFPRDGVRPRLGETISFEVKTGPDGRKRAEAVERPGARRTAARIRSIPDDRRRSRLGSALMVVAIVAIAVAFLRTNATRHEGGIEPAVEVIGPSFTCDGRTHCSEMHSCEEARYFLEHCPGAQMDGDNDGEPCEKQWC